MKHRRWTILVSGKVQGVYYRASTVREAERRGLLGYARNLPDGRVEVVAEGPEEELNQLHEWCRQGPEAAEVTGVQIREEPARGEFSRFFIRYD